MASAEFSTETTGLDATTHTDIDLDHDRDLGHDLDPKFDLDPTFDLLTQNLTLTQIDSADKGFIIKTLFYGLILLTIQPITDTNLWQRTSKHSFLFFK